MLLMKVRDDTFDVGTQTRESDIAEVVTSQLVNLNVSIPAVSDSSEDEDNFRPILSIHAPDDCPYSQVLEELCLDFNEGACGNN